MLLVSRCWLLAQQRLTNNDTKVIMKKNILFLLLIIACSPKPAVVNNSGLLQGSWELASINGEAINASDYTNGTPELIFNVVDKKVNGSTGCNRVTGNFTQEKSGSLKFLPLATTRMFCPGQGEPQFLEVLQSTTRYKVENGKLTLLNGKKEVMGFVSKR